MNAEFELKDDFVVYHDLGSLASLQSVKKSLCRKVALFILTDVPIK